ncbi:hypothetical protein CRUP_008196, partial [Coryphaenoides rupestris]
VDQTSPDPPDPAGSDPDSWVKDSRLVGLVWAPGSHMVLILDSCALPPKSSISTTTQADARSRRVSIPRSREEDLKLGRERRERMLYPWSSGWSPAPRDRQPWLQVDLGRKYRLLSSMRRKLRSCSSEFSRKTQFPRYVLKWKEMSALEPGWKYMEVLASAVTSSQEAFQ